MILNPYKLSENFIKKKLTLIKNGSLDLTNYDGVNKIFGKVSFDIKADAANPLADGAVFQAFTFSEPADGSGLPAAQHVLIAGDSNVAATWTPRSYTFTTAGNVDGGVSLLFELVCGGAATCGGIINIDNVSLTIQ